MLAAWRRRLFSVAVAANPSVERLRNFGIIAHIDAGKTTVSERMLYYTGQIRHIGEVHEGDTMMDYMEEERKRGITIQSSCISLPWNNYRLNLIDSPGHVDFTVEVERCMRVMDGAVTVLDGIAGVQVQTETVWSQADKYNVPRIIFVNKMDRDGADIDLVCETIRTRLGASPWVLQLPQFDSDRTLTGIIDLINLSVVQFGGDRGKTVTKGPIIDQKTLRESIHSRNRLLETISESNDSVLEKFVNDEAVSQEEIHAAICQALLSRPQKIVPVFCGAAYRNIGVQPLLDAVCRYLPPPKTTNIASSQLDAIVFKIINDSNRGLISFTRIYDGCIKIGDTLRVRGEKCRVSKLLRIVAGDFIEIPKCTAGEICGVVGLKSAKTGDKLLRWSDAIPLRLPGDIPEIEIPVAVFFCSIEPETNAQQDALDAALAALAVEDPSLEVGSDPDTGQTLVKGMGELHLDIVRQRLLTEFRIPTTLGRMSVSYRESPTKSITESFTYQRPIGNSSVTVVLSVSPSEEYHDGVRFRCSPSFKITDHAGMALISSSASVQNMEQAVMQSASNGTLLGYALCQTDVCVENVTLSFSPADDQIQVAVIRCLSSALRRSEPALFEPIVDMELHCSNSHIGDVISDLSRRRRAQINEVLPVAAERTRASAQVPLSEMIGYATAVRSLSQGSAHYSTRFRTFRQVPAREQAIILSKMFSPPSP